MFLAKPISPPGHTVYIFPKGNFIGLYHFFQYYDWTSVVDEPNVHTAFGKLTDVLQEGIDKFVPQKFIKPSKQRYPDWFSKETINLLRQKERIHRKFKRTSSSLHYEEFSRLRSQSKKSISRDQARKYKNIQQSFLTAQTNFWRHVSKVTKPKHGIDVLVHNGKTLTNDVDIASCLGSYFASVYKDPKMLAPASSVRLDVPDHSDFLKLPLISPDDVLLQIRKLKPSLSVGVDKIPAFIIKGCGNVLSPILATLFNKSLESNIMKVVEWYQRNYLSINVTKTRVVTFTRKFQYMSFPYEVEGAIIPRVQEIVDLGFLLDHKLLFNKYVADTVSKCFSRFVRSKAALRQWELFSLFSPPPDKTNPWNYIFSMANYLLRNNIDIFNISQSKLKSSLVTLLQ
ncbi:hypothetical protein M8J76_005614 [Diaphorina citri]|nr:hypothetical protein M8J76_005614 [Diaphorina citri]